MSIHRISSFSEDLLNPGLDMVIDYSEIGLDQFIDDPVIKDIPVVKHFTSVIRVGIAIKERFFLKKLLVFLKELHDGSISKDKLDIFKVQFEADLKYREKITEYILVLIEDFNSTTKAKALGHLFQAHVEREYSWERFVQLCDCLSKLQEGGYNFLRYMNDQKIPFVMGTDSGGADYASVMEGEGLMFSAGIGYRQGVALRITKLGQELYKYGISKVI